MGFSVYGRIGGQNNNNVSNYGKESYYPQVMANRSYLNVGSSRARVSSGYAQSSMNQPFNPKSTTVYKKENKKLKTALLIAGTAALTYIARKPIGSCVSTVKSLTAQACGKVSNVTLGQIGRTIAKPFMAIAKIFAKKP